MSKAEKVKDIIQTLEKLYPDPKIPLDHKDAYTLLISVLLSAQCTDERVNKTTPFLFKQADNPHDMVKMSVEEIREIIMHTAVYSGIPTGVEAMAAAKDILAAQGLD